MSTELVMFKLNEMETMANAIAQSGLFGVKTPQQALALMLVAQSENRHPATITQDYDIIQGKACRKTHSVMSRFQQMGGKVEWHELTDQKADATFSHQSGGSLRMSWTLDQAKKAGLTNKDNWKNYPRAMLRARCIAEAVRAVYPAAIGGMLVAEEAQDIDRNEVEVNPSHKKITQPAPHSAPESYPADKFETNFPKWSKRIELGEKTAEQYIEWAMTLTDEQQARLRAVKPVIEAEVLPGREDIAKAIAGATSRDEADAAIDIASGLDDEAKKALIAIYNARIAQLEGEAA